MNVLIVKAAKREAKQAYRHYENERESLGQEFQVEAEKTLQRIISHPKAGAILPDGFRRRRFDRFPYAIVYSLRDDAIIIVAVMHLSRRPGYWAKRLPRADNDNR